MKDSPTLVTATEVPFMPVLETAVKDPYDALTLPVSIAFMRKRRSAASNDMWGCKYQLIFLFIVSYFQWTGAFVGFKKKKKKGGNRVTGKSGTSPTVSCIKIKSEILSLCVVYLKDRIISQRKGSDRHPRTSELHP